jgi:hypothetical protein
MRQQQEVEAFSYAGAGWFSQTSRRELRVENQAPTKVTTAKPMRTAPRRGWLVAKKTIATTTTAIATAIRTMVEGLMRMSAL